MAILRKDEIRDMDVSEIDTKIEELRQELLKINTTIASGGTPDNPGKIKAIRRTIARMKTIRAEKGVKA
ncbi:MAG TPA: 50S ribosomal protein L29 [Euryarchaeota archaeon]|nr:50S ribosomal protein L29 [archaeon BMS3Abin16]GBE56223.1 50S ribosomal protein L29 [archaeon BMS3Bbin16]HDH28804.1 50S ribosomal protein L29 [Euryarchaeota archaeon]HDY73713.1 50S ribosomal protein L29 [Euryarchaeota archaeon]